jgi:hypothetical protein
MAFTITEIGLIICLNKIKVKINVFCNKIKNKKKESDLNEN